MLPWQFIVVHGERMAYQLTAKGAELTRRMTLENPCVTDTSEHFLWIAGAMMAVCSKSSKTLEEWRSES